MSYTYVWSKRVPQRAMNKMESARKRNRLIDDQRALLEVIKKQKMATALGRAKVRFT